jgi:lysophospholipase L1-like esterase
MKPIYKNVLLLGFSCVVALGIGEALVRVWFPPPPIILLQSVSEDAPPLPASPPPPTTFSLPVSPNQGGLYVITEGGRRLRPNTICTIEHHILSQQRIELRINSLGYRHPEIGAKTKERILFLGDSITFGDYLQEDETFVRLVESLAAQQGKDWETINAGVGAIGIQDEIAILQETGLSVTPDVVVLDFYLNDFQTSPSFYVPRLPRGLDHSWLLYYIVTIFKTRLLWRIQHLLHPDTNIAQWQKTFEHQFPGTAGDVKRNRAAFYALIAQNMQDWGGAWSPYAWQAMSPFLHIFKQLAAEHHFQPVIVAFPVLPQVEAEFLEDYPQQRLKEFGKQLDIPVLDLLPILREAYRTANQPLFYDLCHHTPYGNKLIAEHIFAFLVGPHKGNL